MIYVLFIPSINWKSELTLPEVSTPTDLQKQLPDLVGSSSIFVTGATGFLGIFLLREVFEQFSNSNVICLVREGGKERLVKGMKESGTWKDEYNARLEIVCYCERSYYCLFYLFIFRLMEI